MTTFESQVESRLTEGVYDPGILKAVFLAGSGGSGKGFTGKAAGLDVLGLKTVNVDDAYELLLQKADIDPAYGIASPLGQELRDPAKRVKELRQKLFINGRLGLVIDATSAKFSKTLDLKKELEGYGYDCAMIMVDVDLERSIAGNMTRALALKRNIYLGMLSTSAGRGPLRLSRHPKLRPFEPGFMRYEIRIGVEGGPPAEDKTDIIEYGAGTFENGVLSRDLHYLDFKGSKVSDSVFVNFPPGVKYVYKIIGGRNVDDPGWNVLRSDWGLLQDAKKKYQSLFGRYFFSIDNQTFRSPTEVAQQLKPTLIKMAAAIVQGPVRNPIGRQWLADNNAPEVRAFKTNRNAGRGLDPDKQYAVWQDGKLTLGDQSRQQNFEMPAALRAKLYPESLRSGRFAAMVESRLSEAWGETARGSVVQQGSAPISQGMRYQIGRELDKIGNYFPSLSAGLGAISDVLSKYQLVFDNSSTFYGPSGRKLCDLTFDGPADDPFMPGPQVSNSALAISWHRMPKGSFEVISYLS